MCRMPVLKSCSQIFTFPHLALLVPVFYRHRSRVPPYLCCTFAVSVNLPSDSVAVGLFSCGVDVGVGLKHRRQ